MKTLTKQDLSMILGGSSQPADFDSMTCTGLQNIAGMFGDNWTPDQWDEWAKAYEKNCYSAVVTPQPPSQEPVCN